jgi:predicted permease
MRWFNRLKRRLDYLFHRGQFDREMEDEMRFHLEMSERDKAGAGADPSAARSGARREVGSVAKALESSREVWGWSWLEGFARDLRYSARRLAGSPGFTLTAVGSLAIGLASVTTIFTLINALLLRPLPGRDPGQLVTIYTSDFSGPLHGASSYSDYLDFRANAKTLRDLAAYAPAQAILTIDERAEPAILEEVTSSYFDTLGVSMHLGRGFVQPGGGGSAPQAETVLSYRLWQDLGGDAALVGKTVRLDNTAYTVVGVAEQGFQGFNRGLSVDAWRPIEAARGAEWLAARSSRGMFLVGRLAAADIDAARSEFAVLAARQYQAYPEEWHDRFDKPRVVTVESERESRIFPMFRGPVLAFLGLLAAAAALVMAVACANVAGLFLVRATQRTREISVRLALGAGRMRVARQLLTESVLVAGGAAAIALLFAYAASRTALAALPQMPFKVGLDLTLDAAVFLFGVAVAGLTAVAFGLAPALRASRVDLRRAMAEGGPAGRGGDGSWLRSSFLVAQVAVSTVLLIGAGLLWRSFSNAGAIELGFNPDRVVVATVDVGAAGYDEAMGRAFYDQLETRLAALPGVDAAAVAHLVPFSAEASSRRGFSVEGYHPAPGEDMEIYFNFIGASYFRTLGMTLKLGRELSAQDAQGSPPVAVVNEAFVRRFWPGQNAVGKRLAGGSQSEGRTEFPIEVVGVVADARYLSLSDAVKPRVYLPSAQAYGDERIVLVRAQGDIDQAMRQMQEVIREIGPAVPVIHVQRMNDLTALMLWPVQTAAWLAGALGVIALLLTATGLYGMVAYSVRQRTKEVGIRSALGAGSRRLAAMLMGQGFRLTLAGLGLGLGAAFGVTRFAEFLLYGVSPVDPWTFVGIACLLTAVVTLGCWLPARRAARGNPVQALRYE